ncbi:Hemimethylated DNA-binding region [Planctomycetales bacterium 10988]|nr:Hemimethylated DNA-binding region [Planctomycetales bacterium 10988]
MIQINTTDSELPPGDRSPRFQVGQIVHHRRYRYRGLIVALDEHCQASMQWYFANQTQPKREQPWYHVLVDQALHTTYVAQENLALSDDPAKIIHPLVEGYFSHFLEGRYVRNDRPWEH